MESVDYEGLWRLSERIHASGMYPPKMTREGVYAAMVYGAELGLPPVAASQGIHLIEGKLAISARMLQALILRAGYHIDWIERTTTVAHVRITRGDDSSEVRYTIDDAKKLGLTGKRQWIQQPRAMLTARAFSEVVSSFAADVLGGAAVYTDVEVRDMVDDAPEPRRQDASMATGERPAATQPEPPADWREKAMRALAGEGWTADDVVDELGIEPTRDNLLALYHRAKGGERPALTGDGGAA